MLISFALFRRAQKSEEKRHEGESRYRDLAETTIDWVWETDINGVITYTSPRISQLLGYLPNEVIGRNIIDLTSIDKRRHGEINFPEIITQQKPFHNMECIRSHKDGHSVITETSGVPFFDNNGGLLGYRGIERDITEQKIVQDKLREAHTQLETRVEERTRELKLGIIERKKAEDKADAANDAKSQFLANISHELRTPMHAILSFSEMGRLRIDTVPKKKLLDYFSHIHEGGQRLMRLLNDLLDLTKLETGHMDLNIQKHDLGITIDLALKELIVLSKEKDQNIKVDHPTTNAVGNFDADRMLQVIRNLLSNAIKFTEEGKTIALSYGSTVSSLTFMISDQGIGIPESERNSIFDKFVQSSKTTAGTSGTGLGLAICKEIIEGHGGTISAESNPEGGAVFSFVIPCHPLIANNDGTK